jgi:excinuclease ABC subunit C
VLLVAVAKGAERKPGRETLLLPGRTRPLILRPDAPALHLIQQIRDEAHRFAISGHRRRRARARTRSALEDIEGLGPVRRRRLLQAFGGVRQVSRAGTEDLARIHGISRSLAQKIYEHFHDSV